MLVGKQFSYYWTMLNVLLTPLCHTRGLNYFVVISVNCLFTYTCILCIKFRVFILICYSNPSEISIHHQNNNKLYNNMPKPESKTVSNKLSRPFQQDKYRECHSEQK